MQSTIYPNSSWFNLLTAICGHHHLIVDQLRVYIHRVITHSSFRKLQVSFRKTETAEAVRVAIRLTSDSLRCRALRRATTLWRCSCISDWPPPPAPPSPPELLPLLPLSLQSFPALRYLTCCFKQMWLLAQTWMLLMQWILIADTDMVKHTNMGKHGASFYNASMHM